MRASTDKIEKSFVILCFTIYDNSSRFEDIAFPRGVLGSTFSVRALGRALLDQRGLMQIMVAFRGNRSADRAETHQLVNNRSRKTSLRVDSDLWATTARPHLVGGGVGYECDQF